MNTYHLFLAFLLLLGGSAATLFTKWADEQKSPGVDGCERYFRHPFMQAWAMTLGEMVALWVYAFIFYCKTDDDNSSQTEISTNESHDKDADKTNEGKEISIENQRTKETTEKERKFYKFPPILFLPTALCHMTGRILFFISLTLTDVVSVQMLRGSIIIFTSMACRIFLHRKLPLYRWFACFVITAGIVVVGVADIFPNPLDKNDSSNDSSNSLAELNYRSPMLSMESFGMLPRAYKLSNYERGENDTCPEENSVEPSETNWVGDVLVIVAMVFLAGQMTYEDKFVKQYKCPPLQTLGTEGTFGFVILSIALVPLYWIPAGDLNLGNSPRNVLEDSKDGFIQLYNNPTLLIAFIGAVGSISFTNFAGITLTKAMTATHRMVIDQARTIVIWVVSLAATWSVFNPIHLVGFLTLLLGIMLFNNILFGSLYERYQKKRGRGSFTPDHRELETTKG